MPVLEKLAADYLMLQWDKVATRLLAEAHVKAGEPDATDSVDDKAVVNQNSEEARTQADQSVRMDEPEPQQSDSQEAVGDR